MSEMDFCPMLFLPPSPLSGSLGYGLRKHRPCGEGGSHVGDNFDNLVRLSRRCVVLMLSQRLLRLASSLSCSIQSLRIYLSIHAEPCGLSLRFLPPPPLPLISSSRSSTLWVTSLTYTFILILWEPESYVLVFRMHHPRPQWHLLTSVGCRESTVTLPVRYDPFIELVVQSSCQHGVL